MDVREGDVLLGKFRVERTLGRGGMGVVVAARHERLGTRVALKLLQQRMVEDPTATSRFLREAQAAAQLRGEHVARVTDVGVLESGAPYMVMEYLEGRDLGALVHEQGPLDLADAAEYVAQACEALVEAHALGIVHRDIKPSNLFLTRDLDGRPCIKVLDFGVSKLIEASGEQAGGDLRMTDTFTLLGSPVYMAPEQMRAARNADARSDLWSMGVTLYELVTGRLPFEAGTMIDLALKVANEQVPPPRMHRSTVTRSLEAVILRCLEKDPASRWGEARQLRDALRSLRLSATPPTPFEAPPSAVSPSAVSPSAVPLAMRDTAPSESHDVVPAREPEPVRSPYAETLTAASDGATPAPSAETSSPWSTHARSGDLRASRSGGRRMLVGAVAVVVVAGCGALALSRMLGGGHPGVVPSSAVEMTASAPPIASPAARVPPSSGSPTATVTGAAPEPTSSAERPVSSAVPSPRGSAAPVGVGPRFPHAGTATKGASSAASKPPPTAKDPFADPN
jgi:serine/threonine-protein kinase